MTVQQRVTWSGLVALGSFLVSFVGFTWSTQGQIGDEVRTQIGRERELVSAVYATKDQLTEVISTHRDLQSAVRELTNELERLRLEVSSERVRRVESRGGMYAGRIRADQN